VDAGVPAEAITLDFAGFRTLDSVVRATAVFKLERYTVISQRFHLYRAIFIARNDGVPAIAYAPPETKEKQRRRVLAREALARCNAIIDLFLLKTRPKFLGDPVRINLETPVEIPGKPPDPAAENDTQPARAPSSSR
jgi:SanA protein